METTLKWSGNVAFSEVTSSGHEIKIDGTEDIGGQNAGTKPMELLLQAVAGCTGINVIWILKRMRLEPISFHMELKGDRAEEPPKPFTNIHIHYVLEGELPEQKVARAIALANDKYCSVTHSLNAKITVSYSINGITGK
ncbi:OsmC family protein [Bacillus sp. V3B]|uniref:OsmC family protein n=1 Tax=Bacillus sp. V3B TaxID=2804915 RepID=UPI002108D64E|nr:OsmC family protein [Bacillus sp. V3B]MCQ6277161.1 OsmC family protein [Bacillus sp. V3B]